MNKSRLNYLDIIRAIAVIPVVVCHFTRECEWAGIQNMIKILPDQVFGIYLGTIGVTLFFIISGASLMYVYDDKLELSQYFWKRFNNIYPMFWLCFFIAFLWKFFFNGGLDKTIPKWTIIFSALGIDGNVYLVQKNYYILGEWFLGCIIFLYLCFPLLRFIIKKQPVLSAVGILILHIILVITFNTAMPQEYFFLLRLIEFSLGIYFVKYFRKVSSLCMILSLGVIIVFSTLELSKIPAMIKIPIVGAALFLVLVYFGEKIKNEVVLKTARALSKYSYVIFLTHHVIINGVVNAFLNKSPTKLETCLLFLICCVVTGVISKCIYNMDKYLQNVTWGIMESFKKKKC